MGSRFQRPTSTVTYTHRRILVLSLTATSIISGTGAVLSDGGRDGVIALSNGPVAQPAKLATELYLNMRNGRSIAFTEAGNAVAAMISEDKESKEGTEVSEGSETSESSETTKTIESMEQSTSREASESTEQLTTTEAGESIERPETSETSESSDDASPGLNR